MADEFDPYDSLYEATFDGETLETRKLSRDDLDPEIVARIEQQLDEGVTLSCHWEQEPERRRQHEVTAIHAHRPRVRNPLAEAIVRHVTSAELDLTIDLGDGKFTYRIRRVAEPS